jgi:tetratricopeptide (TPR) repeat protein/glycosyltransferase involved in cell wall biosynthesis
MAPATAAPDAAAQALFASAVTHHLSGNTRAAITGYREAIARDPGLAEAYNNLASLLAPAGDDAAAEQLLLRAVELQPDYGEAHNNLGILWSARGDFARALPSFERAVSLDATRAPWLSNLGNAYVEHFRFREALESYDRAIALAPDDAEAWSNRGLALRGLRRPEDAIASFQRALAIVPSHVHALSNLAILYKEQKQLDAAVTTMRRALELDPSNVVLWCNFAAIYEARGDFARVRELALRAIELDPDYAESHNLLANADMEAGDYDLALRRYESVLAREPENRNANWNVALLWLLKGDFERGWRQFEWRKRLQSVVFDHGEYPGESWTGDALDGRDILLHSEQGVGDAIQFIRYAPLLKARGAGRVYLECPYPIVPLLSGVRGVDGVVARGTALPRYDVHANLMSLPGLVGTTLATVPAEVPYIPVEPRAARDFVRAPSGALAVGIVWAGNPIHARDHLRSAPLASFLSLARIPGVAFFSLQKGEGAERELSEQGSGVVHNLAPHLEDFRDTAAVIQALDLVITVDTSVAHLAGALGRETWLLLPHVPDFRWMVEREDSPWYPTMRLFRQPRVGDWESVFTAVEAQLRERASRGGAPNASRPAGDQTVVSLTSTTRYPDGRARFDLWVPLAALAQEGLFAEYEGELVAGGHDLPVRAFLDEVTRAGDTVIDVKPGLGLASLTVATAPVPPGSLVLVDDDAANASRIRELASRRNPALTTATVAYLEEALAPEHRVAGGRAIVRVGAGSDVAATVDAITRAAQAHWPAAVLWSAVVPASEGPALDALAACGYITVALSLIDGEPSLDAIDDPARAQSLLSITQDMLDALSADAADAADAAGRAQAAPTTVPLREESAGANASTPTVGIDWELRADTGWGVYGTHLALGVERSGLARAALFATDASELAPVVRFRLDRALREGAERVAALGRAPSGLAFDGLMLRALGNNFGHSALWERVTARRNAGVIFFEDTAFDADALRRARSLELIVTGSHWNEEVLRGLGIAHVATVLQGVDTTVFHPAPSSGHLAERFVVFSGGKLEYRKGQDLVVAAFRAFHARHPEALLLTAWHNNWPQLIADLDLAGHVQGAPRAVDGTLLVGPWLAQHGIPAHAHLDIGRVPNAMMGAVVREANVALFPNRCEGGTNLVAMECMASGVPTIVSDNSGHRDLVATGGVIPLAHQRPSRLPSRFFRSVEGWGESAIDEMVEALEAVYADRARAAAIAARGADAMARHAWPTQIARLLQALAPLL